MVFGSSVLPGNGSTSMVRQDWDRGSKLSTRKWKERESMLDKKNIKIMWPTVQIETKQLATWETDTQMLNGQNHKLLNGRKIKD